MLNSRDIDLLRPDIAANCRSFVTACKAAGYRVLVTGTVRDDAFQLDCYKKGTGGKPPATFHSVKAGLAFDVCQNIKGREYNDLDFWSAISKIGKKVGFTWGGDWTDFVDKPHFQWDAGGRFRGRDIIAGKYPPTMPPHQEESEDMTEMETRALFTQLIAASAPKLYQTMAEIPTWAQETIAKLMKSGALTGSDGALDLSYDQVRILVINDRAGLYKL